MALKRGIFVVIEGADGTGKSTQVLNLTKRLQNEGYPCKNMRFPDRSTQIGGMIDRYLKCESDLSDESIHLLFSANRWELSKTITSTLLSGTSIICDRYAFSGVAYTSAKPGFSLKWCMGPDCGLPQPDKVIYLSASETLAQSRPDYGSERYEKKDFQTEVGKRFQEMRNIDNSIVWTDYTVENSISRVTEDLFGLLQELLHDNKRKDIGKLWLNCS